MTWDFTRIPVFSPGAGRHAGGASSPVGHPLPQTLQAELKIGAVDDPLEYEADRMANQAMRGPVSNGPGAAGSPQLSRKSARPEGSGSPVPGSVHEVLRTPGQPLETGTQALMKERFKYDFSHVRIHAGAAASRSAGDVGAQAYTVGSRVVFAAGRYRPEDTEGKRLLAHELVHVMQQGGQALRLQRSPTHVTLVSIDDIEREKPGSMHAEDSHFKAATIGTESVTIRDEDKRQTETLRWNDVRNSLQYVDNSIISVGAEWPPFAPKISKLLFKYADGHITPIPLQAINLDFAARSDTFVRRGGVIYPLAEDGSYAYDAQNTPTIVHGTRIKLELFYKLAAQRLVIAQTVFSFAMDIAQLGGAAAGMPEGRMGANPNAVLDDPFLPKTPAGDAAAPVEDPVVPETPGGDVAPPVDDAPASVRNPSGRFAGTSQGDVALDPDVGLARELHVAEDIGGKVAKVGKIDKIVSISEKGQTISAKIDVLGPNGELVVVGGPMKAANLAKLGNLLQRLSQIAKVKGVRPMAYFAEGTSENALTIARRWLGPQNVRVFKY